MWANYNLESTEGFVWIPVIIRVPLNMDLKNAGIFGGITDKYLCRGSLKSKVQQNTPDLSVSGPDKNILKIYKKSIKEIFQITSV